MNLARALVVAGSLAALLPAAAATAQPGRDLEDAPPAPPAAAVPDPSASATSMRVDFGVASPVGEAGIVISRPITDWLGAEAGLGYGLSGVQASAMATLRLGHGRNRFTPGVGASVGFGGSAFNAGHPGGDLEMPGESITMPWVDLQLLGYEYRSSSGLVFAAALGLTIATRDAHWDFADLGDNIHAGDAMPALRVGVGKTL